MQNTDNKMSGKINYLIKNLRIQYNAAMHTPVVIMLDDSSTSKCGSGPRITHQRKVFNGWTAVPDAIDPLCKIFNITIIQPRKRETINLFEYRI